MASTIILFTAFLILLGLAFLLWVLFLRLGLRWANVQDITIRQIVKATIFVFLLSIPVAILCELYAPSTDSQLIAISIAQIVASILIPCLIIRWVFDTSFLRAMQAWLATLIASILMIIFVMFVFRPFIYEAFTTSTNAMAPTIRGNCWQAICPDCGLPNYCTALDDRQVWSDSRFMICDNFHVNQISDINRRVDVNDRFFVNKFYKPRRWDVVFFQAPENPNTNYMMRLIGLPGETIQIKDGAVWADGKRLLLPEYLQGIEFVSEMPGWNVDLWGTEDNPAALGEKEYFVLGDFSVASLDSRSWREGAPGYQPFAVPESHLQGVVTHIDWPPKRWRVLR